MYMKIKDSDVTGVPGRVGVCANGPVYHILPVDATLALQLQARRTVNRIQCAQSAYGPHLMDFGRHALS